MMVIIRIITLVVLPVEIAFQADLTNEEAQSTSEAVAARTQVQKDWRSWEIFNYIVDSLFIIDLILNFRTAYVDVHTEEVKIQQ